MLNIITEDHGRIGVMVKGGRSPSSKLRSISQLYTYGNFEISQKGSLYWLRSGSVLNPFYELSYDIERISLAAYLCDLANELTDEGGEDDSIMRLLLNSLYAISKELYPQEIIKGAFELRAMAMSGYAPDLGACAHCGRDEDEHFYLHIMNGSLLCSECFSQKGKEVKKYTEGTYDDIRESESVAGLTPAVLAAMRYCLTAPLERLFAFGLEEKSDVEDFSRAAQTYLLSHLERGFDSLNFYRSMRAPLPQKENKV
jgi:DNA repair protein RecO (recombination protein O)